MHRHHMQHAYSQTTTAFCVCYVVSGYHRTYSYSVRAVKPGQLTNTAQVLFGDSNPVNDVSPVPVTVVGTCGNPDGSGTRPACDAGAYYAGPNNAPLADISMFTTQCCVSL